MPFFLLQWACLTIRSFFLFLVRSFSPLTFRVLWPRSKLTDFVSFSLFPLLLLLLFMLSSTICIYFYMYIVNNIAIKIQIYCTNSKCVSACLLTRMMYVHLIAFNIPLMSRGFLSILWFSLSHFHGFLHWSKTEIGFEIISKIQT